MSSQVLEGQPVAEVPAAVRSLGAVADLIVGDARDGWGPRLPVQLATTAAAPDVLVVVGPDGTPMAAVRRTCPHRGLDLAVHGRVVDGEVHCSHKGYAWCVASGVAAPTGAGAADLALGRVEVVDGEVLTDLPATYGNLSDGG